MTRQQREQAIDILMKFMILLMIVGCKSREPNPYENAGIPPGAVCVSHHVVESGPSWNYSRDCVYRGRQFLCLRDSSDVPFQCGTGAPVVEEPVSGEKK